MSESTTIETVDQFTQDFKNRMCAELQVVPKGIDRFIVITPMTFGDGDGLPIVLKKEDQNWILSDEGHTFLQLSYDLTDEELRRPTRNDIIERTLANFSLENRNEELVLPISNNHYGDALYSFIQALLKIDDIRYLSRERARSTFMEDFKQVMEHAVLPNRHVEFNWFDSTRDPQGNYTVDCRVNGTGVPLFVFALPSEERAGIATISLLRFGTWNLEFKSNGIFEEQEDMNPKNRCSIH